MKASNFSLEAYLERVQITQPVSATLEGLQLMMRQQLMYVPFENVDVQAGRGVSLVPEAIVEKIITQRRGGYCYEINGLFSMALEALGIPYIWVAARPMFYPARRPKTHMAVLATVDGETYLCDMGFGSYGIAQPIALSQIDTDIVQGHDCFRLAKQAPDVYTLQARVAGTWTNQYAFDLSPQEWVDFEPANYLNSHHPDAVFVKQLLVIQHHAQGRWILFGNSLKDIRNGITQQKMLTPHEIETTLAELFALPTPQSLATSPAR